MSDEKASLDVATTVSVEALRSESERGIYDLLRRGATIAGKYRIERVLGRGGMGVVAEALDTSLERRVAIKFLLVDDERAAARFVREARAAASIQSEHIARVHEIGTLPDGDTFIVMEYLDGADLATLLATEGRVSVEDAAGFVLQACEALAEAHEAGIVHRDLKPSNLFLAARVDDSVQVKVLDFGVSKNFGASELTTNGALVGTPAYMSPEQLQTPSDVDLRTDIWALGVVLYQLVTGKLPFEGETLPVVCLRILQSKYETVAKAAPEVPSEFAQIIDRCLRHDRKDRYQTVAELAQALAPLGPEHTRISALRAQRVADSAGRRASRAADLDQSRTIEDTAFPHSAAESLGGDALSGERLRDQSRRPSGVWGTVGLLAVASLGAGGLLLSRSQPGQPPGVTASSAAAPIHAQHEPKQASPSELRAVETKAGRSTELPAEPRKDQASAHGVSTRKPAQVISRPVEAHVRAAVLPPDPPAPPPVDSAPTVPSEATRAPTQCRLTQVLEGGAVVQRTPRSKITFELARELCQTNPHPQNEPYQLSQRGIVVRCICN